MRAVHAATARGQHVRGHEVRQAQAGVIDAIVSVHAQFVHAAIAFIDKQLLRPHAAELAILADIAEGVQIHTVGGLADTVHMRLQAAIGNGKLAASLIQGEPNGVFGRSRRGRRTLDVLEPE